VITDLGKVFTTLKITRTLGMSPVIQKITLFNKCPEIFMEYLTNWKQKDVMLKLAFNTSTYAETVTADAAYCAIESKTNPETPCDKARYEKICHKYFDLSTPDNTWGLAMLNEGKYAFDVNGGLMKLTMLRACKYPSPAPEAWVNMERIENEKTFEHKVPIYSGLGPFSYRYALLPHKGGALRDSNGSPNVIVKRRAEEFNKPVIVIPSSFKTEFVEKLGSPLIDITLNISLEAFKFKEWEDKKAIIIRIVESSGISTIAEIKFSSKFSEEILSIISTDLLERPTTQPFKWDNNKGLLSFEIGRFEIRTFELGLSS
jgi:alpha-mannosidase